MMELTNIKIKISKEKVLKRLDMPCEADKRIDLMIDKEIEEAYTLFEPYCIYKEVIVEKVTENEVKLDVFTVQSRNLARIMKKAKKATLMAVTIGAELEKRTGNITIDTIRDAIGSIAVESLADELNEIISNKAESENYKTLFRFSAGYCDWSIEDQKKIINVLKPKKIKLLSSHMMYPQKSISAIIGWEKISQ